MPNKWMNQSTLGDTKQDVQVKTPTSSTRHEIRINTKLSLTKQRRSVLVRVERTTVQLERSVCGTQYQEMNPTEFGEVFLIAKEMH